MTYSIAGRSREICFRGGVFYCQKLEDVFRCQTLEEVFRWQRREEEERTLKEEVEKFLFLQTEVKQTGTVRTEVEERMQCHNLQHRGERMRN